MAAGTVGARKITFDPDHASGEALSSRRELWHLAVEGDDMNLFDLLDVAELWIKGVDHLTRADLYATLAGLCFAAAAFLYGSVLQITGRIEELRLTAAKPGVQLDDDVMDSLESQLSQTSKSNQFVVKAFKFFIFGIVWSVSIDLLIPQNALPLLVLLDGLVSLTLLMYGLVLLWRGLTPLVRSKQNQQNSETGR
jgi:hypothetical protein